MQNRAKISCMLVVTLVVAIAATFFCACQNTPDDIPVVNTTPNLLFPQEFVGAASGKTVQIVSIGQSNDASDLAYRLKFTDIGYNYNENLSAADLSQGDVLFVVVGCSMKGMAEKGTTKEQELARAEEFVAARSKGVTVIAWHTGGVARRGNTSDSLIEYVFSHADLALFNEKGNFDNMLNHWAESAHVCYCQFSVLTDVLDALNGGEADV